jgi:hypothetical protein
MDSVTAMDADQAVQVALPVVPAPTPNQPQSRSLPSATDEGQDAEKGPDDDQSGFFI